METKDETLKSQIAIRCAKAAILLASLPNRSSQAAIDNEDEEKEMIKREIVNLKVELAKERMKNKKIKLCGIMEVALLISMILFVSSLIVVLASNPN